MYNNAFPVLLPFSLSFIALRYGLPNVTMAAEKVSNDEHPTEYLEKVALDDSGRGFVPPSAAEESAVIRKLDWHLLPLVFVLYSLSVLDRSNLGNAKLAGMTKDINLTGNRYNWLGTLFYIACKSLSDHLSPLLFLFRG